MSRMIPDLKGNARYAALLMLLSVFPMHGAENVRIEIRSSWFGWGGRQSAIVISGENSKYSASGHLVAADVVKALFSALDEPPVEKPSLENCGIDSRWLNANVALAQKEYHSFQPEVFKYTPPELVPPDTSAQQIKLFRSHFTDVAYVRQAFEHSFKHSHTDDYPEIKVEILRDGKKVSVRSNSQHLFMLPWIVNGNRKRPTFNCHISRSIAGLLPSEFTNRDRLIPGKDFAFAISDEIESRTRHLWDTEETLGADLARIRSRFTILDSDVSCEPWVETVDGENCLTWNGDLKEGSLPDYLHLDVSLTYKNGRLDDVDRFMARISDYSALVRSVPWLAEFMSQHQGLTLRLSYGPERSLNMKAVTPDLGRELREHHKTALADRLSREYNQCALLQVEGSAGRWSRWIVFPNREMLLWQFEGDSALKWKARDLKSWECSVLNIQCTDTVIPPNGNLGPS